jgi:HD superfamily phosphohydrolase YqeK
MTDIEFPDCIPDTPLCRSAYFLAMHELPAPILNHSIRVYLYATALADTSQSTGIYKVPPKSDLLFVSCILHDLGARALFTETSLRFEVEGADTAASHLRAHKVIEEDVQQVWQAIALHTTPHIAEKIGELPRIVRLAVLEDFGDATSERRQKLEEQFPRMQVEKVLGDAVVKQALQYPGKAPAASWPGLLVKAKLAETESDGINKAF